MVYYDNIPEELKKLDQWVCANDGSKVPMKAWENEAASSTNPETWSDFETALESYNQHYYDYCGFVFADNGYVGIDIDEGYDEDGLMSVLGADIVGKCHSYTEKSRSGRGFHILLRGTLPFKGKNNLAGVEIYKAARYFIMTGNTLLYREIIENQEAIDCVVEKYFPEARETSDKVVVGRDKIYGPGMGRTCREWACKAPSSISKNPGRKPQYLSHLPRWYAPQSRLLQVTDLRGAVVRQCGCL